MRSAYGILHWTCLSSITTHCLFMHRVTRRTNNKQTTEKAKKTVSMMLLCKLPQKKWRTYIEHTSTYERVFFSTFVCALWRKKCRCDILFSWMQLKYAKLTVRKNFFCQCRRWEIAAKREARTRVGETDDTIERSFFFIQANSAWGLVIDYFLFMCFWQYQWKRCVCHICWILFVKCVFEYE